jgi:transposase
MPAPLSVDLRKRVLEAIADGATYPEVAARFGIGTASVSRWLTRLRTTGNVEAKPTGGRKSSLDDDARSVLRWLVWSQPDATLQQLVEMLEYETGHRTNDSTLSRVLAEMGLTRKKSRSSTTDARTKT